MFFAIVSDSCHYAVELFFQFADKQHSVSRFKGNYFLRHFNENGF